MDAMEHVEALRALSAPALGPHASQLLLARTAAAAALSGDEAGCGWSGICPALNPRVGDGDGKARTDARDDAPRGVLMTLCTRV